MTASGNSFGSGYGVATRLLKIAARKAALGWGMSVASVGMIWGLRGGFVFHQLGLPMPVMILGISCCALYCVFFMYGWVHS